MAVIAPQNTTAMTMEIPAMRVELMGSCTVPPLGLPLLLFPLPEEPMGAPEDPLSEEVWSTEGSVALVCSSESMLESDKRGSLPVSEVTSLSVAVSEVSVLESVLDDVEEEGRVDVSVLVEVSVLVFVLVEVSVEVLVLVSVLVDVNVEVLVSVEVSVVLVSVFTSVEVSVSVSVEVSVDGGGGAEGRVTVTGEETVCSI